MKISQAKDQARAAARPQPASDLQPEDADEPTPAATRAADAVPIDRSSRRWTVRVHWGIVFAIVASLILWFAIKSAVDLAF